MTEDEIVHHIREAVPGLIACYRFGSQAQGTARPESDVDLALIAPHAVSPSAKVSLREELALMLNQEVDLVDLYEASTVMRMQVISTGECLFGKDDPRRAQFETMVYASYARLNEERRGILDDIRARGRVYAG